jgi:5-methylcytosine-specific restriction endonuclease McrA
MKAYVKTFMKYFGYSPGDFIPCESCGGPSVEIHHLEPKSIAKGKENLIDNLAAVCRQCHDLCHSSREFNEGLKLKHRKNLLSVKTDFETEIF